MNARRLIALVLAVSAIDVSALPNWWQYLTEDDLSRLEQRALDYERRSDAADSDTLPEVENYDLSVPTPYGCSWCLCFWCKRELTDVRSIRSDTPVLLASAAELKAFRGPEELTGLYTETVIKAERYERPLADGVSSQVNLALGGKQSGVVVTLHDGRKFFLVKGNQHGRGRQTILIMANHMTSDWVKTVSNSVSRSTLGDFMKAAGSQYNLFSDNGNAAADRMMALP